MVKRKEMPSTGNKRRKTGVACDPTPWQRGTGDQLQLFLALVDVSGQKHTPVLFGDCWIAQRSLVLRDRIEAVADAAAWADAASTSILSMP